MSTKNGNARSQEHVDLELLRRRQEEARIAEYQQRLQAGHARLDQLEADYASLVTQLDRARAVLPDMAMKNPEWEAPPDGCDTDAGILEGYVARATETNQRAREALECDIARATRLKRRRERKAAVIRECEMQEPAIRDLKDELRPLAERFSMLLPPTPPTRPAREAELEDWEAYLSALRTTVAELTRKLQEAIQHQATAERVAALAGERVQGHAAADALIAAKAQADARECAEARRLTDEGLAARSIAWCDVPETLHQLIADLFEYAARLPGGGKRAARIALDWVVRAVTKQQHAAQALALLNAPPPFIQERSILHTRCQRLIASLEKVAFGEPLTRGMLDEYNILQARAATALQRAFGKADYIAARRALGEQVFEGPDGGLIIIDSSDARYWLEVYEVGADNDGAFVVTEEVCTDYWADLDKEDEKEIIDKVCRRHEKTGNAGQASECISEVIERNPHIRRTPRPPKLAMTVLP